METFIYGVLIFNWVVAVLSLIANAGKPRGIAAYGTMFYTSLAIATFYLLNKLI